MSRAKEKLTSTHPDKVVPSHHPPAYLEQYVNIIKNGDTDALEKLLSDDIAVMADGGSKVKVIRDVTIGRSAASDLLFFVYHTFQKRQTIKLSEMNHQPALLYYQNGKLLNCQVFELMEHKICSIYTILDPEKLALLP